MFRHNRCQSAVRHCCLREKKCLYCHTAVSSSCFTCLESFKHFRHITADQKLRLFICRCRFFVDDHQMPSPEILNKRSCRFHRKGCAGNNQRIRIGNFPSCADTHIFLQRFPVQHHIRLDHSAAVAAGNSFCP